jgi:hypothetical protein
MAFLERRNAHHMCDAVDGKRKESVKTVRPEIDTGRCEMPAAEADYPAYLPLAKRPVSQFIAQPFNQNRGEPDRDRHTLTSVGDSAQRRWASAAYALKKVSLGPNGRKYAVGVGATSARLRGSQIRQEH